MLKKICNVLYNTLQKSSLWRFVRHNILEIHLADHCNLNCAGCSHYSPLAEPKFCDLDDLDRNLSKLSKYEKSFHCIHLLGGEPLLNPDISTAFKIVRRYFKSIKIELLTNGILLINGKLPDSFWETCREYNINIYVTFYPVRNIDYVEIRNICIKKGVKFRISMDCTTNKAFTLFGLSPKKDGDRSVYKHCFDGRCWQLVGNRIYPCAQSAYVDYLNKKFGCNFKHCKGDYLEVDKISKYDLLLFKYRSKPFCAYCVFPRRSFDWKPSERKAEEWIYSDNFAKR